MIRPLSIIPLAFASLITFLGTNLLAQDKSQVVDGIAAVVNTDVITYSQVRAISGPHERLLQSQFKGDELVKQIKAAREAALKDLIDRQLIVQSFAKEKFELPDFFVDQRVNDIIKESFGGDRQSFIKTLQAQNYSLSEFKKHEKESIIVQAMRSKNVKKVTMIPHPRFPNTMPSIAQNLPRKSRSNYA